MVDLLNLDCQKRKMNDSQKNKCPILVFSWAIFDVHTVVYQSEALYFFERKPVSIKTHKFQFQASALGIFFMDIAIIQSSNLKKTKHLHWDLPPFRSVFRLDAESPIYQWNTRRQSRVSEIFSIGHRQSLVLLSQLSS